MIKMIAYLILTILYFLWTRALVPRLPADFAGLAAIGAFRWVLLFFIGLTFARAFCRYYRIRRLPALMLVVLALLFLTCTAFTGAQIVQPFVSTLPAWLVQQPLALTIPVALCAGASLSMLWCGATSPKYVSKHGRGH